MAAISSAARSDARMSLPLEFEDTRRVTDKLCGKFLSESADIQDLRTARSVSPARSAIQMRALVWPRFIGPGCSSTIRWKGDNDAHRTLDAASVCAGAQIVARGAGLALCFAGASQVFTQRQRRPSPAVRRLVFWRCGTRHQSLLEHTLPIF